MAHRAHRGQASRDHRGLGPSLGAGTCHGRWGSPRKNHLPCVCHQVWPLQQPLGAKQALVAGPPIPLTGALGIGCWGEREPHGGLGLSSKPHGVRNCHFEKDATFGWLPEGRTQGRRGWCRDPRGPRWKQPGPSLHPSTAPAPKACNYVVLRTLSLRPRIPLEPTTTLPKPFARDSQSRPPHSAPNLGVSLPLHTPHCLQLESGETDMFLAGQTACVVWYVPLPSSPRWATGHPNVPRPACPPFSGGLSVVRRWRLCGNHFGALGS